jgi:hypothetical protein
MGARSGEIVLARSTIHTDAPPAAGPTAQNLKCVE